MTLRLRSGQALRQSSGQSRGFTFVELIVSMAILLAVTGSMFSFVHTARHVFEVDLERSDMQQRARVALDALYSDLVMAGAGLQAPAVAPFRRGDSNPDLPGVVFADRVSVKYVPPDSAQAVTITYACGADAAGVPHVTRYDGRATELPVADHVGECRFEYFDAAGHSIALARFADGPWVPDAVAIDRFDADLQAIRRVRVVVRVQPTRTFAGVSLSDLGAIIDVSPRNINLQ
jgi:prepilin-type N-terminal cleavage/methylation domain-containing protein